MIGQLGIAESVDLYPGYVSTERSALFFAAADAVVLPYRRQRSPEWCSLPMVTVCPSLSPRQEHFLKWFVAAKPAGLPATVLLKGFAEAVGEFLDSREKLDVMAMRPAIEAFRRDFSWESFADSCRQFF